MLLIKTKLPQLQLLTLFSIAFALMLTENGYARKLMTLNMFFTCVYFLMWISDKLKWSNWQRHVGIVTTLLFHLYCASAKNWDQLIGFDVLLLFSYFIMNYQHQDKDRSFRPLIIVLTFSTIFTLLHWLAISTVELEKNALNIWFGTYLTVGIWTLAKQNTEFLNEYFSRLVIMLLLFYTLSQSIGVIEKLDAYGTTKNPHYLALYSAFSFCISIYFAISRTTLIRWIMILNALILGYFILLSSSRPVWIAMICSAFFLFIFANKRQRLLTIGFILLFQALLFSTNVADYRSRFSELSYNIASEERVPIWKNAVSLQALSTAKEWVIGHGIDRFRKAFAAHSTYNSSTHFHSPHNLFLEVLFTFGILGLATVSLLYYLLYKYCFAITKTRPDLRGFSCLLLTILTINLLFNAINMPFFSKFNIYQINFIAGILCFIFIRHPQKLVK